MEIFRNDRHEDVLRSSYIALTIAAFLFFLLMLAIMFIYSDFRRLLLFGIITITVLIMSLLANWYADDYLVPIKVGFDHIGMTFFFKNGNQRRVPWYMMECVVFSRLPDAVVKATIKPFKRRQIPVTLEIGREANRRYEECLGEPAPVWDSWKERGVRQRTPWRP